MPLITVAQPIDPLDPFASPAPFDLSEEDKNKSAEELVSDAEFLLIEERPLDARSKLLLALEKDPQSLEAHTMLAAYYLVHVGHYKLALKHVKQALHLFTQEKGKPPYSEMLTKQQHAHMLHLLSQTRLNLDNYEGALAALDEYASYDYYQTWYPGSRAWILMKLGKLDEAIGTARLGLLAGAEPGRTLNILGILLSMSGQRQASLQVFQKAIAHEYSLGERLGQPATPLNNSGEVYREIFEEDKAEKSWLKATSLPDGCEHVLPSLNLAILMIEQTKYQAASRAIDSFESCVAQFPLRNGEEHRALVHLARGRIALHTGFIDEAIEHFESARKRQQWFGKIGTSEGDLRVAVLTSLAQALRRKNNQEGFLHSLSTYRSFIRLRNRLYRAVKAHWLFRRATQILSEDLNAIEDVYVRNTDSMLEYPTLGQTLAYLPTATLENRIALERKDDRRGNASLYYDIYLADSYLAHGQESKALKLYNAIIRQARDPYDAALKLHASLQLMKNLSIQSKQYTTLAQSVFMQNRAALFSYGLKLPVNLSKPSETSPTELSDTAFFVDNSSQHEFIVSLSKTTNEYSLLFSSRSSIVPSLTVKGENFTDVLNKFTLEVFRQKIH